MQLRGNPFLNVVGTGMATADLSCFFGYTIQRIILQLGGTFTKAQMTGIRIKANSKTIYDDTGARTDTRMQYRGITAGAAFLTIDFTEIRARTIIGQMLGGLDTTKGITSLLMEVDIAGATSPTLTMWAEVTGPQTGPEAFLIGKALNVTQNFAAAGEFPVMLPFGRLAGTLIKRIHYFGSTVTGARVKKNGIEIHNSVDAQNDFLQAEYQRTPQTNVYHVDFVVDGNMSNVLNAANATNMEYYVTVSGAGNVTAVVEMLDPLANN